MYALSEQESVQAAYEQTAVTGHIGRDKKNITENIKKKVSPV